MAWRTWRKQMPLFLEVHAVVGPAGASDGHGPRRATGEGALCLRHWLAAANRRAFCLIEADDIGLASALHDGEASLRPLAVYPVEERL